ncbi:MFS transporter [Nonomuraea sp. B5E05]|uniref:MFS transporter n=1 Tax=Nonomuraea sp. B5E05 TaxID=3153569 RepID=UPI00326071E4
MQLRHDEKMARKAGIASLFGTAIEWYDFYIFGTAAALVFGPLFFPQSSPGAGVLASFATFWVGFLARPFGGIIFGHLGDRIGRKRMLITTLLLMGTATVGIGLLPTYETIGPLAPVSLVLLRAIQGLAVGGEWGGAVLIATEHTDRKRSVLFGAFAQQGSPIGHILAALAFSATSLLSDEAFMSWGWRIPFLVSSVLIVIGLIIRLGIEESPVLARLRDTKKVVRYPLVDVLKKHRMIVLIATLTMAAVMTSAYIRSTFMLSWGTADLGFQRQTILSVILIASIVQFCVQPFGAVLANRFDPRKSVTAMLVIELGTLPVMFLLLSAGSFGWALVGVVVATIPNVMFYATTAGLLAQAFPGRVRYTGISVSYALSSLLFGGSVPFVGQALLTMTGSIVAVVVYAMLMVCVSIVGVRALIKRTEAQREPDEHDLTAQDAQPSAIPVSPEK